jgi:hypothetical protein
MLVERGAKRVISFDIVPPPKDAWQHPNIEWVVGDITNPEQVQTRRPIRRRVCPSSCCRFKQRCVVRIAFGTTLLPSGLSTRASCMLCPSLNDIL